MLLFFTRYLLLTLFLLIPIKAFGQKLSWETRENDSYAIRVDGIITSGLTEQIKMLYENGPNYSNKCGTGLGDYFWNRDGEKKRVSDYIWSRCRLILNSPGGNLAEALALGRYLLEAGIPTMVRNGDHCLSACAWIFLAGNYHAVTSSKYRWDRLLEDGGLLGFHGYSFSTDQKRDVDETPEFTQTVTLTILEYIKELSNAVDSVSIDWIAEILTVPSNKFYYVSSHHDYISLSIDLPDKLTSNKWGSLSDQTIEYVDYVNTIPNSSTHLCNNYIDKRYKDLGGRVVFYIDGKFEYGNHYASKARILSVREYQNIIKSLTYTRLMHLSDPGSSEKTKFQEFLEEYESELEFAMHEILGVKGSGLPKEPHSIKLVELERGGGFYYDYCLLINNKIVVLFSDPSWDETGVISTGGSYPWPMRWPLFDVCAWKADCINIDWSPGPQHFDYTYDPLFDASVRKAQENQQQGSIDASELRSIFINYNAETRNYLQRTLRNLGLYSSSIDGKWGKGTESAFQKLFDTMDEYYPDLKWRQDFGFEDGEIDANEFGDFWNAAVGCGEDKMLRITDLCQ